MRRAILLIIVLLLIIGCGEQLIVEEKTEVGEEAVVGEGVSEEQPTVVEEEVNVSCQDDADCEWGKRCINGECKTIEELYDLECEQKCNFNSVIVETSDGDSFTLNRGEGSYTAAGALAWKLLTGPAYCPGDEVIVPMELKKMTTGKVLNKQVITVKSGEESEVIKHPTAKRVSFTLKVVSVNEECG